MSTETKEETNAVDIPDLTRRADGRLIMKRQVEGKTEEVPVRVVCCFPWTRRQEYISIRDDKGHEEFLVRRLEDLPEAIRVLVEEELTERLFVPRITAIESITSQAELSHWTVVTDVGPRSFLTTRGDHPRHLSGGRILVQDVSHDLYLVENPAGLDARSRKLLWVYME